MENFKKLNPFASDVLVYLVQSTKKTGKTALKINNAEDVFLPVCIEILEIEFTGKFKGYLNVSIAHYGEQNGDLMRDPEMCFLVNLEKKHCIPYYFRNDYVGNEQELLNVYEESTDIEADALMEQEGQAAFANIWMKNICEQQELKIN